MTFRKWELLAGSALYALMTASMASAQANGPSSTAGVQSGGHVEEIVVTANRREQNMQKVPVAIAAFSTNMLTQKAITSTSDLSQIVSGLTFTQTGNYGTPFLRGVGNAATGPDAEPSVATYVDGVYRAEETGTIFDFNNIERVEVLKGPQGTLFGRNATGGVIQIITKDPQETPHADVQIGYGSYNTFNGSLYATSGIAKNLAADISIQGSDQEDGWGRDITNGKGTYTGNSYSFRTKWLWKPDDDTKITATADYLSVHGGTGYQWHLLPGSKALTGQTSAGLGFYDSMGDFDGGIDPIHDRDSAARTSRAHDGLDETTTPGDLITPTIYAGADTLTQEFQLLSAKSSKINWVLGAFYIHTDPSLHINVNGAFVPGGEQIWGHEIESSYAGYGQATMPILPGTNLTVGLRYTVQDNHVRGYSTVPALPVVFNNGDQHGSFEKVTYRFALDHQFTPDIMGYVSYNRGFKSGFFNLNTPGNAPLHPEILDAAEIGAKTELFDHHLKLNSAAFHYQYSDIQVGAITNGSEFFYNGAAAEMYGLDVDFVAAATDNLTFSGALEAMHGSYTNFPNAVSFVPNGVAGNTQTVANVTGNPTTRTPVFSGNLGVNYNYPLRRGSLDFNLVWSYSEGYTWDPNARLRQPAMSLVNGSIRWAPSERYDVRLWAKNMLNKHYYAFESSESVGDVYSPAAPATYGVTFAAHF